MASSRRILIAGALLCAPLGVLAAQSPAKPVGGNAATGAKLYLQCRACHTVAKGGAHSVGPNLWGVMGTKAAARPGYSYSPAMKATGIIWTAEAMDAFLAKPNARVPGNKMAFAGIANPAPRRDLIAYLSTLQGK